MSRSRSRGGPRGGPRLMVAGTSLAIAGLCAVFAWELQQRGAIAIDDAYITFSYAKNLATGHGPVYGHGVRVEGYSNFLWMVVMAVGLFFRRAADPTTVAHIAGLPFVILLGFATYRLCRLHAGRLWSLAALALLAINVDVAAALLIGLETILYMALLALSFMLYLRSFAEPRLRRWVVPALTGVALTRIDGFVPLAFVLAFEAGRRLWRRDGTLRDYVTWAAPGLLVYGVWFAWRWAYYGLPLPTTYYAKQLIPRVIPHRGFDYVRDQCVAGGSYLALPFALVLIARRRLAGVFLTVYCVLHTLYVIKVGGDWMPYGRFMLPLFPLLVVIIIWGGVELAAALRPRAGRAAGLLLVLPLAALGFIGRKIEMHLTDSSLQRDNLVHAEVAHVRGLIAAARLLNRALPPGARLVTDYGGVFAYYTDAAPIEMWGLCNADIALHGDLEGINPIFGKTCPACYPKLDPEFFHTMLPIVRTPQAFHSHQEVVRNVWQTDTIGRYLDFQRGFVSGRVVLPSRNQAVFFLQRRQPGVAYRARAIADGGVPIGLIDYPFEPGGRAASL